MDNNNNNNNSHASPSSSLDEYILVDPSPSLDDDDDDDDDEYDYCDDVSSQGSIRSDCLPLLLSLTDELILDEAAGEPSMERVLEEAHASASPLLGALSKNFDNVTAGAVAAAVGGGGDMEQPKCFLEDHQVGIANDMPGILESSASDNSLLPHHEHATGNDDDDLDDDGVCRSEDVPGTVAFHDTQPESSKPQLGGGGRMSNKKRRKKMKQLKKAAAAAKAAVALSSTVSSSIPTATTATSTMSTNTIVSGGVGNKSSNKFNIHLTSRYNKRRVANIAVACATESLVSYKAQITAKSKKVD